MLTKKLHDPNGIVSKLIFEDGEAIWETVVYQHEDRGVICFSCQSGCRVGCLFCGTGKRFIRNLTGEEMGEQVYEGLILLKGRKKVQLMCMSMGEPMDNWTEVCDFIRKKSWLFSDPYNYSLFISTVGLNRRDIWFDFHLKSLIIPNFGVQISLHHWDEEKRRKLLGNYPDLMPLEDLRFNAKLWTDVVGRPVYWNYICKGNETEKDAQEVQKLCEGMHVTCSVLCNTSTAKKADPAPAQRFADMLLNIGGVDVSVFDPAGQDTIGGGCGQLLYVQQKLRGELC